MPKIVCISDTHNHVFPLPEGDILLHSGDFSFTGNANELVKFDRWMEETDIEHKILVPGNHELSFEEKPELAVSVMENVTVLGHLPEFDGQSIEIMGLKIWGEPRQPWFYDWAFNVPRGPEADKIWEAVPDDIDIVVTHGPPYGMGDRTVRGENVGCTAQKRMIDRVQPKLVVCGHIHSGYGKYVRGNTLIVNASVCNEQYKNVNPPVVINL